MASNEYKFEGYESDVSMSKGLDMGSTPKEYTIQLLKGLDMIYESKEDGKQWHYMHIFDDVDCIYDKYEFVTIDLSDPDEYITKISGIIGSYITKLVFKTNLGKKYKIGDNLEVLEDID